MKLINDKCEFVIERMIANKDKVDLVVTDPPYLHVKGGMKNKKLDNSTWGANSYMNTDMRDFDEEHIKTLLNGLKGVFRTTYNGYFFCSKLQIPYYLDFAVENKLSFDLLVWDRNKKGMICAKFYASNIDYVVRIYGKKQGLNKVIGANNKADVEYYKKIQVYKQPKEYGHPTEKPVELLKKYILLSSDEGNTVFDPYMGTGSTGQACLETNREFIGVELKESIYETAMERLNKYE